MRGGAPWPTAFVLIPWTKPICCPKPRESGMSYGRIEEVEPQLEAEVKELLGRAAEVDESEDAEYGVEQRGDELPEELRRREGRLEKIREAKRRLEVGRGAGGRSVLKPGVRDRKRRQPPPQMTYPGPRSRAISPTRTAGS